VTKTFWLSTHVAYQCRDAGACCSAGWPIPLERSRVAAIERWGAPRAWLLSAPGAPDDIGGVLALGPDRHCVFHQTPVGDRGGCQIHHALGHRALPSACQHFPRVCLLDRRGVSVTLSHYCPTAAALLFAPPSPVTVVEGPPALPDGEPEGFDAREALPPFLTAGILMDDSSYAAWERHMIVRLTADPLLPPETAVAGLDLDAREMSNWRPGQTPLVEAISSLGERRREGAAVAVHSDRVCDLSSMLRDFEVARGAVPAPHAWPAAPGPVADLEAVWRGQVAPAWMSLAPVVHRFLAAHAFGSWMAYQGNGLLSVIRSLRLALAVLRVESIRQCLATGLPLDRDHLKHSICQTDLLLVHFAQREELARRISALSA
jgi:hypothetical protein